MTSESQDTRLTSHPKDGTLHRAVSPITALGHWDINLDQRKECLLLALQHHFQQHLVSHPGTDQDQPCLASESSQQWDMLLAVIVIRHNNNIQSYSLEEITSQQDGNIMLTDLSSETTGIPCQRSWRGEGSEETGGNLEV